jgi:hypothetical protein
LNELEVQDVDEPSFDNQLDDTKREELQLRISNPIPEPTSTPINLRNLAENLNQSFGRIAGDENVSLNC